MSRSKQQDGQAGERQSQPSTQGVGDARGEGVRRRDLVGLGAAAVGALALGCQQSAEGPTGGAGSGAESASTSRGAFELEEMTIVELEEAMSAGRHTSESVTKLYLDRIEAMDRQGPMLRSIIEVNPDALTIARELDQERAAGTLRGPLHGVPIVLKDNVATADNTTTTAGSLALEGASASSDSPVAAKLREAGAVLLAKANLSEWANFRSNASSSGWSSRGGQCANPYALDRNPCGSSSGTGASVSANFAAAGIGTETNGSIVCPSSANGLVGIKPTVGLVSRAGIIPIAETQDTAGPMARSVADAAVVLGALVGVDESDPATAASEGNYHTDYTQFLDVDGLQGARIGVGREFFGFNPRVDALLEGALQVLADRGAVLVDPVEIPNRQQIGRAGYTVLLYEFKAGVNAYLESLGDLAPVRTLSEVIEFNEGNRDRAMPYFGHDILVAANETTDLEASEYKEALATVRRYSREEGLDVTLRENRLDAIMAPTGGPAWTTDLVNGDHFSGGSSSPAAQSGYANVTVPMGYVFGLPVGVSFFGGPWSEPTLIRIAYAFEQATKHRVAPRFLPTAELA